MKKKSKEKAESLLGPFLVNVNPNMVTLFSIFLTLACGCFIIRGEFASAAVLFAFAGLADAYDGLVARKFKRQTNFGAFFDRVADRINDGIPIIALAYAGYINALLALCALFFVFLASYVSATLEVISKTRVGEALSLRPLRTGVMFAGLIISFFTSAAAARFAVYLLFIIGLYSVITRVQDARRILKK